MLLQAGARGRQTDRHYFVSSVLLQQDIVCARTALADDGNYALATKFSPPPRRIPSGIVNHRRFGYFYPFRDHVGLNRSLVSAEFALTLLNSS
jgi:hypothetical protein